jgi:hypothetical protein
VALLQGCCLNDRTSEARRNGQNNSPHVCW